MLLNRRDLHRRHAQYYIDKLRQINDRYEQGGLNIQTSLDEFDIDWGQINHALVWAREHAGIDDKATELLLAIATTSEAILDLRQNPSERIAWLETAVNAARGILVEVRRHEGRNLNLLGMAHLQISALEQATKCYQEALDIALKVRDDAIKAQSLNGLGIVSLQLNKYEQALDYIQKALDSNQGNERERGEYLGNLAKTFLALGSIDKAIECFNEALIIARKFGDRRLEATHLGSLAQAHSEMGIHEENIRFSLEALAICHELRDGRGESTNLRNLGLAYTQLDEHERAIEYFETGLKICRETEDRTGELDEMMDLANCYFKLRRYELAENAYQSAHALCQSLGVTQYLDQLERSINKVKAARRFGK